MVFYFLEGNLWMIIISTNLPQSVDVYSTSREKKISIRGKKRFFFLWSWQPPRCGSLEEQHAHVCTIWDGGRCTRDSRHTRHHFLSLSLTLGWVRAKDGGVRNQEDIVWRRHSSRISIYMPREGPYACLILFLPSSSPPPLYSSSIIARLCQSLLCSECLPSSQISSTMFTDEQIIIIKRFGYCFFFALGI